MTTDVPSFKVYLIHEEVLPQKLYVNKTSTIQVPCEKVWSYMNCTPTEEVMPSVDSYEIVYEDVCHNLSPVNVTVKNERKITTKEVEIEADENRSRYTMYHYLIIAILTIMF